MAMIFWYKNFLVSIGPGNECFKADVCECVLCIICIVYWMMSDVCCLVVQSVDQMSVEVATRQDCTEIRHSAL